MTSLLDNDHPVLRWGLGLILGGGSAGLIQAGTGLLRLGSTATTGGIANPVVATLENVVSVVLSVLSLIVPVLVAVGVVWLMIKVFQKLKNRPATSS
jgi:hypothetical protein